MTAAQTGEATMNDAAIKTAQKPRGKPFEAGNNANPKGRPKGARSKLGEAFLEALCEDFNANGIAAIQTVRVEKPDQYLKVIASILPKQIEGEDGEPIKAEIIFRTVYEERSGD